MDPNDGNNESVNDGIFAAVAEANHEVYASRGQLDRAQADPAATGAVGGGTPAKPKTQTVDDGEDEGDNAHGLDSQDFSHEIPVQEEDTTAVEEADTDTTPSQTETKPEVDIDWKAGLPEDPGDFTLEPPKPDEYGQIDPSEYGEFIKAQFRHEMRMEEYNARVITATFDTVEKILPEIKEDAAIQAAIRNTYYGTLSADETVNLAKSLRASLDKVASTNKAVGAQNAKTSITIQKSASVESRGAAKTPSTTTKSDNLSKRLSKGDDSAFEELMGNWLEEGKI